MTEQHSSPWVLRKPVAGRIRARLICVPYAGVGASVFRLWQAGLPAGVELCAIQLPGRESRLREPALTRIDAMVDALMPEIVPLLDRPFALFGHSMGAVVATELAQRIAENTAVVPRHLFVSGRRAPHIPDPDPPLSQLSDAEFVTEINRRFGGIPAEVAADRELLALLLPCLRADIAALESHDPARPTRVACPLTVYGGTQDSRAPRRYLEAWRECAAASFKVRLFEGTHFYLTPRREELLADITETLTAAFDAAPAAAEVVQ
jgi:medium-chain acyl-[acyl-carrier-protein] hydrolase